MNAYEHLAHSRLWLVTLDEFEAAHVRAALQQHVFFHCDSLQKSFAIEIRCRGTNFVNKQGGGR